MRCFLLLLVGFPAMANAIAPPPPANDLSVWCATPVSASSTSNTAPTVTCDNGAVEAEADIVSSFAGNLAYFGVDIQAGGNGIGTSYAFANATTQISTDGPARWGVAQITIGAIGAGSPRPNPQQLSAWVGPYSDTFVFADYGGPTDHFIDDAFPLGGSFLMAASAGQIEYVANMNVLGGGQYIAYGQIQLFESDGLTPVTISQAQAGAAVPEPGPWSSILIGIVVLASLRLFPRSQT